MSFKLNLALRWLACGLVLVVALPVIAGDKEGIVKCGDKLGKSPAVSIADVMKDPDEFAGKSVIFSGRIEEVCQKKGCWMEVVSGDPASRIRVTFKDYGFFVPKDSHGMMVRAEGVFETKVLSKEDAEHLAGEGANIVPNEDGTATELAFVASGVELMPAKQDDAKPKKDDAKSEKS
jgi:hypothetical protein